MLVLILGLSGAAHAFTKSCLGGHCDQMDAVSVALDQNTAVHSHLAQSDMDAEHDGCNPSLCHVVALVQGMIALPQTVKFLHYAADSPPLRRLATPEDRDRPPRV